MKPTPISAALLVVFLFLAPAVLAQSPGSVNQSAASPAPSSASAAEVPRLIKFSGTLLDAQDRPLAGPVGVTFALHAQQTGGAALWLETQNVTPDAHGSYTLLLGANSANGVPAELFASGEARWLEVQVERQAEQPRILLVSVPYALKAKDAETLGGRPASAFLTTETLAGAGTSAGASTVASTALPSSKTQSIPKKAASAPQPAVACTSVTSDGTAALNSIALFTGPCTVQSSVITESGGNVGIGTAKPAVALDIAGNNAGMRLSGTGTHQVTVTGLSSGRLGQDANGFFFASDTNGKSVRFLTNNGALNEWMRITSAGNVGIDTTTPAAKLDINGNLNLPNTTSATVGVISLGGQPFVHNFGSAFPGSANTFLGQSAGNFTMATTCNGCSAGSNTGIGTFALHANVQAGSNTAVGAFALANNTFGDVNTGVGVLALESNATGGANTAVGGGALDHNTMGSNNAAVGWSALDGNTTGNQNTALGSAAGGLSSSNPNANITGSADTFIGYNSSPGTSTQLNNATALGANALVSCSNCMVLGDSTMPMSVGIGTPTPIATLNVVTAATGGGDHTADFYAPNIGSNHSHIHFGPTGDWYIRSANSAGKVVLQDSGGMVGIGTTTPATALHVSGVGDTEVSVESTAAGGRRWTIQSSATQGLAGAFQIIDRNAGASRLSVDTAGNVGVGTTAPDMTLSVNGNADKTGGGFWATLSDGRLKDLHGSFDSGLRQVLQLRPVRYQYKEENGLGIHDPEEHIGLVAQEVQRVIPEAVTENNKGYLLVNNDPILWSMLNAIKEQQREIQRLTGEVRKLRNAQQGVAQLQAQLKSQQRSAPAVVSAQKTANRSSGTGAAQGR